MAKDASITIRVSPELKAALEAEAADDARTLTSLLTKLLTDAMKSKGRLPAS